MKFIPFLFLFFACSTNKNDKEYISDLGVYFSHHLALDSVIGMRLAHFNINFYGGKMNALSVSYKPNTRFSGNGRFTIFDIPKRKLLFDLPNNIEYSLANSFLYNNKLFIIDISSLKKFLVNNTTDSILNEIVLPNDIYGSNFQIIDSLAYFEGSPYGPSVYAITSGNSLKPKQQITVDPNTSTFAKPLNSDLNFMIGFSQNGRDSLTGYCFNTKLNIKWKITLENINGLLNFYRVYNTDSAFIVLNGENITTINKETGKIIWNEVLPAKIKEAIINKNEVAIVHFSKENSTKEIIFSIFDINSGIKLHAKVMNIDLADRISLARDNEKYILSTKNTLVVLDQKNLKQLFLKKYKSIPPILSFLDGENGRAYTVIDDNIFW